MRPGESWWGGQEKQGRGGRRHTARRRQVGRGIEKGNEMGMKEAKPKQSWVDKGSKKAPRGRRGQVR